MFCILSSTNCCTRALMSFLLCASTYKQMLGRILNSWNSNYDIVFKLWLSHSRQQGSISGSYAIVRADVPTDARQLWRALLLKSWPARENLTSVWEDAAIEPTLVKCLYTNANGQRKIKRKFQLWCLLNRPICTGLHHHHLLGSSSCKTGTIQNSATQNWGETCLHLHSCSDVKTPWQEHRKMGNINDENRNQVL